MPRIADGNVFQAVRAIRDGVGSHPPGVYIEDEYQVATVCQAETETPSSCNVDREFS